jgi:hypothetical protein
MATVIVGVVLTVLRSQIEEWLRAADQRGGTTPQKGIKFRAVTVVSLHLLSANLLIPKLIGSRVNIGPVAATVGMLFWSWLWGGIGLLLAVPLTAFVRLVADCHPVPLPISNLLAERPGAIPRWALASEETATWAIPFLRSRFRVRQKQ